MVVRYGGTSATFFQVNNLDYDEHGVALRVKGGAPVLLQIVEGM